MPSPGEWWWVPDEEQCFVPAKVQASASGTCRLLGEDGSEYECKADVLDTRIDDPTLLDAKLPDLVQMDQVNHPAIIDTLRRRYLDDEIYTGIADILVAINPFKWLAARDTAREGRPSRRATCGQVSDASRGDSQAEAENKLGAAKIRRPAVVVSPRSFDRRRSTPTSTSRRTRWRTPRRRRTRSRRR